MTNRKRLRLLLITAVSVLAVSVGFSRALRTNAARRYLIAHLAASFGRPVDVLWFDFSLLDGARIEAHFVTVGEDPHFGNEYFLRTEALTAGLRWGALLRGRFEFGSISLLRASLNLARDANGGWNMERWLPPVPQPASRPGFVGPLVPAGDVRAERVYQIDVKSGRINFKLLDDKSPFALVDVSGHVEKNGAGRWQLDLEARPMRAGVELQDIGTVRLRGEVAGTTARLEPAELNLTWRAASVADALRLVRGNDYGMRGVLAVDLGVRVAPPTASLAREEGSGAQWTISGQARLTGIHGWRLAERGTDPAANLSVEMTWRPEQRQAELRKLLVEMPSSHLQATGDLDWTHGFHPQLHIESSSVGVADVVSWYRALRPDVAEDLSAQGILGVDVTLGGWPLELERGAVTSAGATLAAKSLPAPMRIGPLDAVLSRGGVDIAPAQISFASGANSDEDAAGGGAPQNSFVLRGSIFPDPSGKPRWPPDWNVSVDGATSRAQDWLAFSQTLAQPLNSGWSAEGGLAIKMRGVHRRDSSVTAWLGTVDFLGLSLRPAYFNQPVLMHKTRVEFGPVQRTITVSAAEALGAIWHGSIARKNSDPQWTFDLVVDRLDAANLDRWLGPRARPGFLERFAGLGSGSTAPPLSDSIVTQLAAHGRLRVGEIDIPPMHVEQFDAEAEVAGRTVQIRKVQADFFGGRISGSLDAQLLPDPSYKFTGRFDRVNLARLGSAVSYLSNQVGGTATASLALSTHGIGRENLIGSMEGEGTISAHNVGLSGIDLSGAFPGDGPDSPSNMFTSIQGAYRIQNRGINLADFVLDGERGALAAEGRIEFSHALNIRVRPSNPQTSTEPPAPTPASFMLGGTIENPKLVIPSAAPKPAARPGSR